MRTTLIKHETNRNSISPYQITGLALELAKLPDGTIDRDSFASCCDQAFNTLIDIQSRLNTLNIEVSAISAK